MAEPSNWAFPPSLQPRAEDVDFDLAAALDSVVQLRVEIPDDAFTAATLGTERVGNGVVIREDGLILTIGYLVTEAERIWITTNAGVVVPGDALAYDQATGFGLVMPLGRLGTPHLRRGLAAAAGLDDVVYVIGHGGRSHALKARIVDRREFAGYWEYLLDEAIFTAPAHPQWGGAAVVGTDGYLLGIGSLFVQESSPRSGQATEGNMIVPIDLLEPVLDSLEHSGRPPGPARPWLGLYVQEVEGRLAVAGLAANSPAAKAGIKTGDFVLSIGTDRVATLADMLRRLWRIGPAGTEIPMTIARKGGPLQVRVRSADRADYLRKPVLH